MRSPTVLRIKRALAGVKAKVLRYLFEIWMGKSVTLKALEGINKAWYAYVWRVVMWIFEYV